MTLSAIRTDVQANWPTDYHSSVLTDDKVDEFINKAQREICRRHNFEFMTQEVTRDTADETRSYSLPTAGDSNWTDAAAGTVRKFKHEKSCELINSSSYRVPLVKRFKTDLEDMRRFKDTTASGTPSHYCIAHEKLELWQIPDHANNSNSAWTINFEMYGYLADLSGDTATNEIVSQYPEALEYLATSYGFKFGFDTEQADEWKARFEEVFAGMVIEDEGEKASAVKDGMRPAAGQSLGGEDTYVRDVRELTAHYE